MFKKIADFFTSPFKKRQARKERDQMLQNLKEQAKEMNEKRKPGRRRWKMRGWCKGYRHGQELHRAVRENEVLRLSDTHFGYLGEDGKSYVAREGKVYHVRPKLFPFAYVAHRDIWTA